MPERMELEPRQSCGGWDIVPGAKPVRRRYPQHVYEERSRTVFVDTTTEQARVQIVWQCGQCAHVYTEEREAQPEDLEGWTDVPRAELRVRMERKIQGAAQIAPPIERKP